MSIEVMIEVEISNCPVDNFRLAALMLLRYSFRPMHCKMGSSSSRDDVFPLGRC